MRVLLRIVLATLCVAAVAACAEENDGPQGLRVAREMGGARIVFDIDAKPLPDIPFPNDVATRLDPTSPTGLRVNVSELAATQLEVGVRQKANNLDGFGVYSPIYLSFTEPLDLHNILARHAEPVPDMSDDAVYLVNVDPKSDEFGKMTMVDLGQGNFPVKLKKPNNYFDFDPRGEGASLLYETVLEVDENGNGKLDPIEDTDDDGVWDHPNTLTPDGDPLAPGEMLSFYERETNTLVIRPLEPLRPATRYAVVITAALNDHNGLPVDSPFEWINHTRQTDDLAPLKQILPRAYPERFDDRLLNVRFAWSYTTGTTTRDLEIIRAGMYGHGPMAWLSKQFPAELEMVHSAKTGVAKETAPLLLEPDRFLTILLQAFAAGLSNEERNTLVSATNDIDYLVSGSFETPYFLVDKDGLQGTVDELANNDEVHDENESFDIDATSGRAVVGSDEVTFHCTIPKARPGVQPPFPVVIYGHGYGGARVEALGFAGQMSKFGIATCAIDNVGHGLPLTELLDQFGNLAGVAGNVGLGNLPGMLDHGRHRDLTNDGFRDPGGDYWTADTFHTRDMVRQTTVDYMQFVRVLRTFDGTRRWPDSVDENSPYVKARRDIVGGWDADGDGKGEIAGDFNGDGVPDIGGDQPYYAWGQSLGGIQSAVLVAIDPAVRAAAPTAGGAGLVDIGVRSTQGGVPEAVILRMTGPVVLGRPIDTWDEDAGAFVHSGKTRFEFLIPDAFNEIYLPFAEVEGLEEGDKVVFRNLTRESRSELVEADEVQSHALVRNGVFRTAIASDAVGTNERRKAIGGFDTLLDARDLMMRTADPKPGLRASWFNRRGARGFGFEDAVESVDLHWEEGEAPDGFKPNEHSLRLQGALQAPASGVFTFKLDVEGRARVWVKGTQLVDVRNGVGEGKTSLEEGELYDIRVDYDRERPTGHVTLSWAARDYPEEIIPASSLVSHRSLSQTESDELAKRTITDARAFGDPYVVEVWGADGELKQTIDTFELDVYYQNIRYPAGTPLAALTEGWGLKRQTPSFRRFFSIAQMILDKADPGSYAPHYFKYPLSFPYEIPMFQDGTSNVLVVPTIGDSAVPVNSGISIARIAGIVDYQGFQPAYGKSQNRYLIDNYVYEGISWLDRFPGYPNTLFDPDDLDGGLWEDPTPDATPPVRATVTTSRGVSAMRIPYVATQGEHGFDLPKPQRDFDIDTFMANQIGWYFINGGEVLSDDPCMQSMFMEDCDFFDYDTFEQRVIQ